MTANKSNPTTAVRPTQQKDRIDSIDVLRGFALLGILMMNIQSFGLIDSKYTNPMSQGQLTGVNYWCWLLVHLFFDSKMMAIFSALFGAGIVLMWQRAVAAGKKSTRLHFCRMFWLLIIGLAHAHLLWHGDILVPYALCGFIVYWVCGWQARWLIVSGLVMLSIGSALSIFTGLSMPHWPEDQVAEMAADWKPNNEQIKANLAIYRGGWLDQLPHRSKIALMMETFLFLFLWFWRAGGLMLLGMALFKLNVFQNLRSKRFYWTGLMIGFAIGFPMVLYGVQQFEANDWSMEYSFFQGHQYNWWGSLFISFGYLCGVMLLCQHSGLVKLLAPVGQMALTNYLLQTIICTLVFYGHGLGWFGSLNRIELIGVVVAVWFLQIVLSSVWLSRFRFGPFEWFWRSLTYWKLQPVVKSES